MSFKCAASSTDALVNRPDDNLKCSVCLGIFDTPQRTRCGHVFCDHCIRGWLAQQPACPECRAPVTEEELVPDRLLGGLIANLPSYCQLRAAGCPWQGKHGEVHAHLANECPCVMLACPGCEEELPRRAHAEHALKCPAGCPRECPFGCGQMVIGAERMAQHRSECLMEPKKLLAALGHLQRENERLAHENLALRQAEVRVAAPRVCREPPASVSSDARTLLSATRSADRARTLLVRAQESEPTSEPLLTPQTKKRRATRGPGMCVE